MLNYLRDKFAALQTRARYQRLIQEQLLSILEREPRELAESSWQPLNASQPGSKSFTHSQTTPRDIREKARNLVATNPHARNVLRLLENYVVGSGLSLAFDQQHQNTNLAQQLQTLWKQFLAGNAPHFSFLSFARRQWRDGEVFVRKFPQATWPPQIRFIDPELVQPDDEDPTTQGILTDWNDAETPVEYLILPPQEHARPVPISAHEIHHTKIGVDANEKRGISYFAPLIEPLEKYEKWLETELQARKLQSSIVLWRKVQGTPSQINSAVNQSSTLAGTGVRKETFHPGTIVTTSQGTDIQFLSPNTNFGDSIPLGRSILLCAAAAAGLPEFMLTSDASNANFASTMVAEGPAVKLFAAEQHALTSELNRLVTWIMAEATTLDLIPRNWREQVDLKWSLPNLVSRDRPRERLADLRLAEAEILSKAEVARRDGVDPQQMQREISHEQNSPS